MGGEGYVYDLDGSDGFMMHTYLQTHQVGYLKYVQLFTCHSYLNSCNNKKDRHDRTINRSEAHPMFNHYHLDHLFYELFEEVAVTHQEGERRTMYLR